jgi:hypothetical protein
MHGKQSNLEEQAPTYLMSDLIYTGRDLHKQIFLEGHYFISQLASPFAQSVSRDRKAAQSQPLFEFAMSRSLISFIAQYGS